VVEHLPSKHEALSSSPSTAKKKKSVEKLDTFPMIGKKTRMLTVNHY
jgi:hypothetical protein